MMSKSRKLSQDRLNDLRRFYAGEALVEAKVANAETFVVEAKEMQDRGVPVAEMYGVFDDVVRKIIRFTVNHAAFDAAAAHPNGVAPRVMVAAVVFLREAAL